MADGLTLDDMRRMQELEAELMRLREIQAAMSPEDIAMLSEDSDMGEAMRYAEQDRDLRRRAEQGDAMANAILNEDVPSPEMRDPNTAELRAAMGVTPRTQNFRRVGIPEQARADMLDMPAMRMDGMGAGPVRKSVREDVMKNLMATEEPEEEL